LAAAVESILADAGFPAVSGLRDLPWRGTPLLTRRSSCISAPRLFALGDAAGYVEPFTGEGIGWALASAIAVTPLALAAVEHWNDDLAAEWEMVYRARIARRQMLCQAVTAVLRRPALSRGIIAVLSWLPVLASPVLRLLNTPPQWEMCRS